MKKIIIIGSGIGGSGIGALIAKNKDQKAKIALFEQNKIIGGRCGSYIKKDDQGRDWKFDVGCHIISNCDKGPLGTILTKIGKDKDFQWSYTKNPGPRVNIMGMELKASGAARRKKKKKKKIKKKSFIPQIKEMSDEEIETWNYISLKKLLDEKLGNKKVLQKIMYSMQAGVMFGTSPSDTSAGEYLKCTKLNAQTMSMGYPFGGCGAIPETYCDCITENNGEIFLGKEGKVKKIIIEDNTVQGVEVGPDNEFYRADIVIANSDIKTTVFKLIGEKYFDQEFLDWIKNLKWGGQVCSLKIGVDEKITDQKMLTYVPKMEGMDNIFTSIEDELEDLDFTEMGVPEKSAQLIVPVSNHDPKLAPTGCQNIHTVTPTAFGKMVKWSKKDEEKWRECCINSLVSLWPDLEDHIIISDFISTSHLEARWGKEGAGTGIAQSIDQVAERRPSQVSSIKGLYLSSGDAGGWGIGTELAAQSALELWDYFQNNNII
ncbi:MAG: NAD(P)/FAD-dependent oxidoreductase [Promethearchaeota archaeon]|nr:MAG: NAD(P)/FAD-dependent oxidoreductase [Candidatus Lokiarchaeota archaeon]